MGIQLEKKFAESADESGEERMLMEVSSAFVRNWQPVGGAAFHGNSVSTGGTHRLPRFRARANGTSSAMRTSVSERHLVERKNNVMQSRRGTESFHQRDLEKSRYGKGKRTRTERYSEGIGVSSIKAGFTKINEVASCVNI